METRSIVFEYELGDAEVKDTYDWICEQYERRLRYVFDINVYSKLVPDDEPNDILVAVLTMKPEQKLRKQGGKTSLGLGLLRKKATKAYLMQLDDISDVSWSKESAEGK